ncbi:MAG: hypothetical protein DRO00_10355 [Thermoproteota archaeon]|nr:MAG: hypothetical protein DRO00_10355 [Candidatus Korarchaeota archaeon]
MKDLDINPNLACVVKKWQERAPHLISYYEGENRIPKEHFVLHAALVSQCARSIAEKRISLLMRPIARLEPKASEKEAIDAITLAAILHDVGKLTDVYAKGSPGFRHELVSAATAYKLLSSAFNMPRRVLGVCTLSILLHHPPLIFKHVKSLGISEITGDFCRYHFGRHGVVKFLDQAGEAILDLLKAWNIRPKDWDFPQNLDRKCCFFIEKLILMLNDHLEKENKPKWRLDGVKVLFRGAVGAFLSILIPSDYRAAIQVRGEKKSVFWKLVEKEVERGW